MGSSPSFFIITISWNNLAGLQTTLQSVVNQGHSHWRCIVIDGASTDGSVTYLQSLADARINWISEKDTGIYNAMNKGIARITPDADYIIFMNSGDSFENAHVLQALSEQVIRYQASHHQAPDLLIGASRNVSDEGTRRIRRPRPLWWRYIGMPAEHQAIVFHGKLLQEYTYDESFRMAGDYEHLCRLVEQKPAITVLYLDTLLCRFYLGGVSTSRHAEALREEHRIHRDILHMNPVTCYLVELAQRARYAFKKLRRQA